MTALVNPVLSPHAHSSGRVNGMVTSVMSSPVIRTSRIGEDSAGPEAVVPGSRALMTVLPNAPVRPDCGPASPKPPLAVETTTMIAERRSVKQNDESRQADAPYGVHLGIERNQ